MNVSRAFSNTNTHQPAATGEDRVTIALIVTSPEARPWYAPLRVTLSSNSRHFSAHSHFMCPLYCFLAHDFLRDLLVDELQKKLGDNGSDRTRMDFVLRMANGKTD